MNFLSYLAVSIVSFLGLAVGVILARVSPEEMPTGRKFFPLLERAVLVAIAAIFINLFVESIYVRVPLYLLAIILLSFRLEPNIVYPLLAFPFFLSSIYLNAFTAISALIFVYGLPAGSLYAVKGNIAAAKFVLSKLTFVLLAVAIYLILAV